jgi:hypothetical protein
MEIELHTSSQRTKEIIRKIRIYFDINENKTHKKSMEQLYPA